MIGATSLRFPAPPARGTAESLRSAPRVVPAWHVFVEWQRLGGPWFSHLRDENRTFRSRAAAEAYAAAKTGMPSLLVPFMFRRGTIVEGARDADWIDRLRDLLGMRPSWKLHLDEDASRVTSTLSDRPRMPAPPSGERVGSRRAILAAKLAAQRARNVASGRVKG